MNRESKVDFENLSKASDLVIEQLRADEAVHDLLDQFNDTSGIEGNHQYFVEPYHSTWGSVVEHQGFIPIPARIIEQHHHVECASFMGLLPEINRAWITVDNRLYLWDYQSATEDVLQYDGLTEVIVSVGITSPKPGVFTDLVKYVLVIATPLEIVLLAVTWNSARREVRLQPTKYTVSSDNVSMLRIVGTPSGRIFMIGNDCNLYEMAYDNTDTWGTYLGLTNAYKCAKVNHSSWRLHNILPPFLAGLSPRDPLQHLLADAARNVLYTMSTGGNLNLYYIAEDASLCVVSDFNIYEKIKHFVRSRHSRTAPDANQFKDVSSLRVVSMHHVPMMVSRQVHLLVTLSTGLRVYLVLTGHSPASSSAPTGIAIAHLRSPPPVGVYDVLLDAAASLEDSYLPTYRPHPSLVTNGAFSTCNFTLMHVKKDGKDYLVNYSEEQLCRGVISTHATPSLRESICLMKTHHNSYSFGAIHDMCETCPQMHDLPYSKLLSLFSSSKSVSNPSVPNPRPVFNDSPVALVPSFSIALPYNGRPTDAGHTKLDLAYSIPTSELMLQHVPVTSPSQRQFLCLTSQGIHVVSKLRPADVLLRVLTSNSADFAFHMQAFFSKTGVLASCVMCLGIACGLPCDLSDLKQLASPVALDAIRRRAVTAMMQYGTTATMRQTQVTSTSVTDKRTVFGSEFKFSSCHDAIVVFFGRIVRPIWYRIMVSVKVGQPHVLLRAAEIAQIQGALQALLKVIKEFFLVVHAPSAATEADAQRREEASIHRIYLLVTRCSQLLTVFSTLLPVHEEYPAAIKWDSIADMSFYTLATSTSAHEKLKLFLHRVLQATQLPGHVLDDITTQLCDGCYYYYSPGDKYFYDGLKSIVSSGEAAVQLLRQASKFWCSFALIEGEASPLHQAIIKLRAGGLYEGIVVLAIATADNFRSFASYRNSERVDSVERGLFHGGAIITAEDKTKAVKICYSYILRELQNLNGGSGLGAGVTNHVKPPTLAELVECAIVNSDDEVLHTDIYAFLLDTDCDLLVSLSSPFVESFLREHNTTLLYRHFTHHQRYSQACSLMTQLAQIESPVPLDDRIADLRLAVHSGSLACQQLTGGRRNDTEYVVLEELQKKLEIAELQKSILLQLSSELSTINITTSGADAEAIRQKSLLESTCQRMEQHLIDISELYNKITEPYRLWEASLMILAISQHDDPALIAKLWRSIIYRLVPWQSSNRETQEVLENKRQSNMLIDKRRQKQAEKFESVHQWLPDLVARVTETGCAVRQHGGKKYVPLLLVVEECEELATLMPSTAMERGWTTRCVLKMGATYGEVVECYMEVYKRWQGKKANKLLHILSSGATVLLDWSKIATGNISADEAKQFILYAKSGKIREWLERLSQHLSTVSGHHLSAKEEALLQATRSDVRDVEQRLTSLLLN